MNKSENLKFILKRFDHYIESVQSKSNLFIILNSLIVTGSITILNTKDLDKFNIVSLVLFVIIVLASISIIMTIRALIPYLGTSKTKSVLFFGDVSSEEENDYCKRMLQISDEEFYEDITKQIYHIAEGLTRKYKILRCVGFLLIFQFIIIIIIMGAIIFIIKNK